MALRLPDVPINLSRARLRLWSDRDLVDLVAAWQDPEMHRWMPEAPNPYARPAAEAFLQEAAKGATDGTGIYLAIAAEEADRLVGSLTFHSWGPNHWNVGYWVVPEYRRRRIAVEALVKASRWAYSAHPNLARISLYTMPANTPSQRVAESAGFTREGVLRSWATIGETQVDWAMYSLIREDL